MLNTHSIGFNYMKLIDMCKRYMKSNARFSLSLSGENFALDFSLNVI